MKPQNRRLIYKAPHLPVQVVLRFWVPIQPWGTGLQLQSWPGSLSGSRVGLLGQGRQVPHGLDANDVPTKTNEGEQGGDSNRSKKAKRPYAIHQRQKDLLLMGRSSRAELLTSEHQPENPSGCRAQLSRARTPRSARCRLVYLSYNFLASGRRMTCSNVGLKEHAPFSNSHRKRHVG